MTERKRLLLLILIMATVSLVTVGTTIHILYTTAFKETRGRLVETTKSWARLVEAVARFDTRYSQDYPGGPEEASLSQIKDAQSHFTGFGRTGEFTLAKLEDSQIVFLLDHRHYDLKNPKPLPLTSKLAVPMRRALSGESGTFVGLDYRGEVVLAAYEPVAELNLGVVAKIDLEEIRKPFIQAGVISSAIAILAITLGAACFFRVTNPIFRNLAESEEKYRNLVDLSPDPVIMIQDNRFQLISARFTDLFGYTLQDTEDGLNVLTLVQKQDKASVQKWLQDWLNGKTVSPKTDRIDLMAKNGKSIPCETSAALIQYKGRAAVLVVIRDITERKRAEEAIINSAEKIKMFAYSVSHDLKAPSIGIYGMTRLLCKNYRDALDEKAKSYCDQIMKASEQLAKLVEQINLYISTKETPLNIETVEFKEILESVRDEFSAQLNIRAIQWLEPESIPEIRADRLSMTRVIRNLVDNALKYGGDDLSEIRVSYRQDNLYHILSFGDNGKGIKGENPEKIFNIFHRHETSRGIEGSGLGLAIVREVAEHHDGKVWTEACQGKGITFSISISRYL